jgi:hypothetical protein
MGADEIRVRAERRLERLATHGRPIRQPGRDRDGSTLEQGMLFVP